MITLLQITKINLGGGFEAFAAHLVRSLEASGHGAIIAQVSSTTEKRWRHYRDGVAYTNVSLADGLALARSTPSLIVAVYWSECPDTAAALLDMGAGLVLHDPTEFEPELLARLERGVDRVIANRATNAATLRALGADVTFIRHPYVPWLSEPPPLDGRRHNAISHCRVDWDKHTETIVAANALVDRPDAVRVHGCVNSRYDYFTLRPEHPERRRHYYGRFPKRRGSAVDLAATAGFNVDMSAITGDGGGSQYSFMEAWDAGCVLVVSREWLTGRDDDEVKDGVNALVVDGPSDLADVLATDPTDYAHIAAAGRATLALHAPAAIVPRYEDFLGIAPPESREEGAETLRLPEPIGRDLSPASDRENAS